MGLTILAIPLIILGVFIKPYSTENSRCISISFAGARCFEQCSNLPEVIKYGSVLAGFALLYVGRMQIKRQRNRSSRKPAKHLPALAVDFRNGPPRTRLTL